MTKGIIDKQLSTTLHRDVLPFITATAFIVHASISTKYAFMRWRIWNTLTGIGLIIIYGLFYFLFLYFGFFYQQGALGVANTGSTEISKQSSNQQTQKTFTVSELAEYNGKDGNAAYVAMDGVVYDLTSVFINGEHFGHTAGQDLTNDFFIKHVKSQITKYPIMGFLE